MMPAETSARTIRRPRLPLNSDEFSDSSMMTYDIVPFGLASVDPFNRLTLGLASQFFLLVLDGLEQFHEFLERFQPPSTGRRFSNHGDSKRAWANR
jgi:hypothetical protein